MDAAQTTTQTEAAARGGNAGVPTRFYMDNDLPATTLTYQRVLEAVSDAVSQLLEPTARRITLGNALNILPLRDARPGSRTTTQPGWWCSMGSSASPSGDAEHRQWAWWIENHPLPRVHVHKASHHGSRNGDTQAAIARLSPEVVIIIAGRDNRYGHPAPEALRLYSGAQVFRTDLHGTIVIDAEPSGRYTVQVEGGEGARPPTLTGAVQSSSSCMDINTAGIGDLSKLFTLVRLGPSRFSPCARSDRFVPWRSCEA